MSTFVSEQVKRLDTALTHSFEKCLKEKESMNLNTLSEKDQFLVQASQALDLTNTQSLPSFTRVKEQLEKYHENFGTDTNSTTTEDTTLEWLFIAKCTIVVYGDVFSKVLNLTLPISESIDYWNAVHGNTFQEIYYALQTAPYRTFQLIKNTANDIKGSSSAVEQIKTLLTSPDYALTQLFPLIQKNTTLQQNNLNVTSNRKIRPFSVTKFFTWTSYYKHRPLILDILREEVNLKKQSLQTFRSEQAASLGILLLTPPQFNYQQLQSQEQTSEGDANMAFTSLMANQVNNCIEMIKYIMGPTEKEQSQSRKNVHNLQKHLSTFSSASFSSTPKKTSLELYNVVKNWSSSYNHRLQTIQSSYGAPSRVTRYWIPAVASYFVGNWLIQYGFKRKDDILHCVEELGKTAHDFILNWVWEPVLKVYDTIRLKDQRLGVLSKEGLQSDLDSLERMVVGFARDNLHMSEGELVKLSIDVREGDISVLLKEYEREIKSPLKSVITGDLLQAILIQVQKTKVDVDLAMSALDKLLKSNELNFAFLAVAPSMLLTWASVSWLRNLVQGRSEQKMKKTGIPMRETLRRIERQLILNEPIQKEEGALSEWKVPSSPSSDTQTSKEDHHQTECEAQGIILCEVHLLRAYTKSLPLRNSTRSRFIEDIRDLENPNLTNEQKIQTIARMSRFWSFL